VQRCSAHATSSYDSDISDIYQRHIRLPASCSASSPVSSVLFLTNNLLIYRNRLIYCHRLWNVGAVAGTTGHNRAHVICAPASACPVAPQARVFPVWSMCRPHVTERLLSTRRDAFSRDVHRVQRTSTRLFVVLHTLLPPLSVSGEFRPARFQNFFRSCCYA
jgi:hypothetical protein